MELPRLIYRGEPDHLGSGQVGENKRVNSQDELDAHLADGWRLTRHIPEAEAPDAGDEPDDEPEGDPDAEGAEQAPREAPAAKPAKPAKKAAKKK